MEAENFTETLAMKWRAVHGHNSTATFWDLIFVCQLIMMFETAFTARSWEVCYTGIWDSAAGTRKISVSKRRGSSAKLHGVMSPTIVLLKLFKIISIFGTCPSPTQNKNTVGKVSLWNVKFRSKVRGGILSMVKKAVLHKGVWGEGMAPRILNFVTR
jgi:hypothetical protein